jgi:large subunit ribosomal protein L10
MFLRQNRRFFMAKSKEKKKKILEDLKEKVKKQKMMVLVNFTGLKVKDFFELRKKLKSADSQIKVVKKTLLNLALKELSPDFAQKIDQFKDQIAIVFGFGDEILPAKILHQFSLENQNLKILAGYFEKKIREKEEIIALAQLPTKNEILASLIKNLSAPIYNFVNVLEGNIKGLISVLVNLKTQMSNLKTKC